MKFGYTIVYVSSVEETLAFYKEAFGFGIKFLHESKGFGELDTGDTTLAFASHEIAAMCLGDDYVKADVNEKPLGVELAFVTDDVAAAYEKAVAAGAVALKAPEDKPWGQTVSYVRAVDGSIVEICSPLGG